MARSSKIGSLLQADHPLDGRWPTTVRASPSLVIRNAHHPDDERRHGRRHGRRLDRRRADRRRRPRAGGRHSATRSSTPKAALVLPGFVQTHIHLCQTLFRGLADDLPLLAWLRDAHLAARGGARRRARSRPRRGSRPPSCCSAARRRVLTMETVHGTDAVFEALVPTGLRAVVGKCLMDVRGEAPARLHQDAAGRPRREPRARTALARRGERPAARGARAALCDLLHARAARSHGGRCRASAACSCTRTRRSSARKSRVVRAPDRPRQHRVPGVGRPGDRPALRGALRLGHRRRAAPARRARRQGAPLPRVESEARVRASRRSPRCGRAASRCRLAPTAPRATTRSTCFRRCGSRRRCRRCGRARRAAGARRRVDGHARRRPRARPGRRHRLDRGRQEGRRHRRRHRRARTRRPARDPYSTARLRLRGRRTSAPRSSTARSWRATARSRGPNWRRSREAAAARRTRARWRAQACLDRRAGRCRPAILSLAVSRETANPSHDA